MHDTHLDILVNKARERIAPEGWPVTAHDLRAWREADVGRLEQLAAKADRVLADADHRLRAIAANADFSDSAKQRQRAEVLGTLRGQLAKLEADAESITGEVAALEARAPLLVRDMKTGGFVDRPTPAPDPVSELQARETRDLLRQMDESQREQIVLGAVHDGDATTLNAALGAPSAFPVLGPDALARVRQAQLERSPAYAHVLSGRQLVSFASMVVGYLLARVSDLEQVGPRAVTAPPVGVGEAGALPPAV